MNGLESGSHSFPRNQMMSPCAGRSGPSLCLLLLDNPLCPWEEELEEEETHTLVTCGHAECSLICGWPLMCAHSGAASHFWGNRQPC